MFDNVTDGLLIATTRSIFKSLLNNQMVEMNISIWQVPYGHSYL